MKRAFLNTGRMVAVFVAAIFVLVACGDEQNKVVAPEGEVQPTRSQLVLSVNRNEDGSLLIKSSEGRVYDLEILRKVIDGEIHVAKIKLIQPTLEGVSPIQAGPPNHPANIFITDVTPWPSGNGVSDTLTWDGFQVGLLSSGAQALAGWTIDEYRKQSGKGWPFNKRSRQSIANEIRFHCWLMFTPLWERAFPIDMGFDERMWGN